MSRATLAAFDLRTLLAVVVLAAVMSSHSFARTWRVERDGSGDFTTIQPAAEAAAPGDSILLGPGHYTEFQPSTGSGTLLNYYIFLEDDNVTVLGVDRDLVKVGPPLGSGFDPKAIGFVNAVVGASIVIEGITFAHCIHAITTNEKNVMVRNCRFESNDVGLNSNATVSVLVENCEFIENSSRGVLQFDAAATPLLIVRNCQFTANIVAIDSQEENNLIENCVFSDNRVGVQFSARGIGSIRNCTLGNNYVGIGLGSQSEADLRDNQIWGGSGNLITYNSSRVTGSGNVFAGGEYATMEFSSRSTADMSGNHILRLPGVPRILVNGTVGAPYNIDLRNNYWGTASAAEIAASIRDSQDDPRIVGTVLFEPFSDQPVATRRTSFGEFKRMFVGEN